ncbi:hypothetical protein HORIV_53450 [Vreelandella olivaria]|uniref:EamA domain-containing protein n=1 Tax=Vreelandella olivaria TaxID=390919 RepID=A0ABN5X101_9GAMM|nr:hypothetical protein HORIV_53450 [Halomonas olivaria]
MLLLSVTFGSLHFALLFIGLEHAEAGTGALLVQMGTPFATLLAVIFLKEKLGPKRIAGLLLSLLGSSCWRAGQRCPLLCHWRSCCAVPWAGRCRSC